MDKMKADYFSGIKHIISNQYRTYCIDFFNVLLENSNEIDNIVDDALDALKYIDVMYLENEKLKDLELYEFRSGGVVGEGYGGIDYILNAKNSKEILLYFKIYSSEKEIGDFKFTESRLYLGEKELEDKKLALSDIFDKNNLDSYYSRDYTELKNGKKLLYGRFILEKDSEHVTLELYYLNKDGEEKKYMYFKEFNKNKIYPVLGKINENKIEGYYLLPFFREEITLFTSDKIIHKKVKFSSRNETLLSESEKELYNYLLDLFKEEIPEEFFEVRNKK